MKALADLHGYDSDIPHVEAYWRRGIFLARKWELCYSGLYTRFLSHKEMRMKWKEDDCRENYGLFCQTAESGV